MGIYLLLALLTSVLFGVTILADRREARPIRIRNRPRPARPEGAEPFAEPRNRGYEG